MMLITNTTRKTHNKHIYVFIHLIVKEHLRKNLSETKQQKLRSA